MARAGHVASTAAITENMQLHRHRAKSTVMLEGCAGGLTVSVRGGACRRSTANAGAFVRSAVVAGFRGLLRLAQHEVRVSPVKRLL